MRLEQKEKEKKMAKGSWGTKTTNQRGQCNQHLQPMREK